MLREIRKMEMDQIVLVRGMIPYSTTWELMWRVMEDDFYSDDTYTPNPG